MSDFDKSKWTLDPSDFTINKKRKEIKAGYMSSTFYTQKSTGLKCIIKKTNTKLSSDDDDFTQRSFNAAISLFCTFKHPAIVPFVGFYEQKGFGYIVEEEIEKGSLFTILETIRKDNNVDPLWDETHKLIILYGISCCMEFLHNKSIIHRDLKPGCILLDSELHPYITGFTCSKKINPTETTSSDLSQTTSIIMAPEFIEDPEHSCISLPIDVYSYAIILYETITELAAFSNLKSPFKILMAVSNGERPEIPKDTPSNWTNLIQRSWSQEPKDRPTFKEICDLLESDEFVTQNINRDIFENYKKLVKPFRP